MAWVRRVDVDLSGETDGGKLGGHGQHLIPQRDSEKLKTEEAGDDS
jgi:hypothetical protein